MSYATRTTFLALTTLSMLACGSESSESANQSNASVSDADAGGTTQRSATTTSNGGSDGGASAEGEGGTATGGTSARTTTRAAGGQSSGGASTSRTSTASATGGKTSATSGSIGGTNATGSASSTGGTNTNGGTSSVGGSSAAGDASTSASSTSSTSTTLEKFSFFVTSYEAMKNKSGSMYGFGGDLRYNESTGLAGADKLCAEIAEDSMPGASAKGWRAFLSTSTTAAIDRITYNGPFYDRRGRVVASSKAGLTSGARPAGADSAIANDLPNENGVGNKSPDGTPVDNHDILTGSDKSGKPSGYWCEDWTNSTKSGKINIGHAWPKTGTDNNWIYQHTVDGCKPGASFVNSDGSINTNINIEGVSGTVGSMGGYGAIYCLASQA